MVAAVDERCSSLELVDEEAEEVRFGRVVKALDAPLGDDAAVVCGHDERIVALGSALVMRTMISLLAWAHVSGLDGLDRVHAEGVEGRRRRRDSGR